MFFYNLQHASVRIEQQAPTYSAEFHLRHGKTVALAFLVAFLATLGIQLSHGRRGCGHGELDQRHGEIVELRYACHGCMSLLDAARIKQQMNSRRKSYNVAYK